MRSIERKVVTYASIVGRRINAQERFTLTWLKYLGYFCRSPVQLYITGMELKNAFTTLQKYCKPHAK
jgi:hypothetical protein